MPSLINAALSVGYPLVILILSLEALGAPLPGETLMIALGTAAGAGKLSLPKLFLAAWVGSVIGDNIGYVIGRRFGKRAMLRLGRPLGLTSDRSARLEASFRRFGTAVVIVARFFVILRQLNGVLAGSLGLTWWRFLAANMVGAALWVGIWLYASSRVSSWFLGLLEGLHGFKLIVLGMLAVVLLAAIVLYWMTRHANR